MTLPRKPLWFAVAGVPAVVVAVALALFEPWRLWVDRTAADPDPGGAPAPAAGATAPSPGANGAAPSPEARGSGRAGAPSVLHTTSTWKTYEHATKGTVWVYEFPDGRRVLRLADLDTSDGPDVRVQLSERPYTSGDFAEGSVDLGTLKGNKGSSNYDIPPALDLADYKSVVIWCERFSVPFGAAPLQGT